MHHIEKLYEIVDKIAGPNGCMWSQKQRLMTLLPYLIEESYEVVEAVEQNDQVWVQEELGDILFVVLFLIYLACRDLGLNEGDIVGGIMAKITRRHPHVFGDVKVKSLDDIARNWEKIKREEKKHRKSVTTGVPHHLGALMRANKLFDTLRNTSLPFFEARHEAYSALTEEEIAEQLLHLTYAAHKKGIDPEGAMRRATKKHLEHHKC